MIYQMALSFAQAIIFTVIVTIIRDVPAHGVFLPGFAELFFTFFLVIFASSALGIAVSCIVKTENAAMTAMPFVLIVQLAMGGVIFSLEGAASLVSHIAISKWGVLAIGATAYITGMPEALLHVAYDDVGLAGFEFFAGHLAQIWFALIVFAFLCGVVGWVSLKFVDK